MIFNLEYIKTLYDKNKFGLICNVIDKNIHVWSKHDYEMLYVELLTWDIKKISLYEIGIKIRNKLEKRHIIKLNNVNSHYYCNISNIYEYDHEYSYKLLQHNYKNIIITCKDYIKTTYNIVITSYDVITYDVSHLISKNMNNYFKSDHFNNKCKMCECNVFSFNINYNKHIKYDINDPIFCYMYKLYLNLVCNYIGITYQMLDNYG